MTSDNQDETIEELFDSLLSRYQICLETQMRESDFIVDCANLLYYQCHKTKFKCDSSYLWTT